MITRLLLLSIFIFVQADFAAESSRSPVLEWFKTVNGSGASTATGAAVDTKGNFYITGNTASLDFPTVAAAQPTPGGSPLIRINPVTHSAQKLYSPGLANLRNITVDPKNPQILYAVLRTTLLRSTDGGNSWKSLSAAPGVTVLHSVAVDPINDNILYIGTSTVGAFKSTDAGANWTAINNGIPPNTNQAANIYGFLSTFQSLDIYNIWTDPKSPAVVFANFGAGLLRSTDGGGSWSVVLKDFGASLVFDPFIPGTIYATGSRYLNKSSDGGQTWVAVSVLPDQYAPLFVADPFHKGVFYAASLLGVYQSTDSGLTWTLKIQRQTTLIAADPNQPVLYANLSNAGIVSSTDGFNSYSSVLPAGSAAAQLFVSQIQVAGSFVLAVVDAGTDVFVTKLDPNGNIVYSTYFGGTANDIAAGIAVGKDGSVYVTGQTVSLDFPVTKGVYASSFPGPSPEGANFVFKLNPDGSVAWSTFFANSLSVTDAIVVDADGNPYIGGWSTGGLPTTPGVFQTQFHPMPGPCAFFCQPPPTSAFLAKFNAQGSALTFSTYIPQDAHQNVIQAAQSIALAPNGDVYFVDNGGANLNPGVVGVYFMNATGTALLGANTSQRNISSIALDANRNLYATGYSNGQFVATPGAFQHSPQPTVPDLPGQTGGGGGDAFVVKFDSTLSKVLAATLLGGEDADFGQSVAIDSNGNVIVGGYTQSKAFPLSAPFQGSFSAHSGFVAGLDSSLSHLLFSTYLGDDRPFTASSALPDGAGSVLVVGSTMSPDLYVPNDPRFGLTSQAVIVNKIALPAAPAVRLDSVVNSASQIGVALSPSETIAATGSGFGPDAKLLLDGRPLPIVSRTANRIVSVVPSDEKISGAVQVTVFSDGVTSNPVNMPTAAASPGIYSVNGSGFGQAHILNSDGTLNSQANPAAVGSAIIILATGIGQFSNVGPFAVTDQSAAVFVGGLYARGIAAVVKPVPGLPGEVYQIGVYVPDLNGFTMASEVPVTLFIGGASSQQGIAMWVKQP